MTIYFGNKKIVVHASIIYLPFNDLLNFLEKVLSTTDPALLSIDEEGYETDLYAEKAASFKNAKLIIKSNRCGEARAIVNRREMAMKFFQEIERFIKETYDDRDPQVDLIAPHGIQSYSLLDLRKSRVDTFRELLHQTGEV